jgi:uncharacterized protein YjiS (DUF1127 family)
MNTISQQTKRIARWLGRATSRHDLASLSDRALRDIGVSRRHVTIEGCKPFWMA